mmetsp:Transcript_154229/g.272309  ORF Transcript_154229/g.272309 Transcript_154229/m.272309 type:complete len:93 (+) Transcript_154229:1953-2231(+)
MGSMPWTSASSLQWRPGTPVRSRSARPCCTPLARSCPEKLQLLWNQAQQALRNQSDHERTDPAQDADSTGESSFGFAAASLREIVSLLEEET